MNKYEKALHNLRQIEQTERVKTDKAGIDYRIVCKDERGIEHQLKRCTVVRCIE